MKVFREILLVVGFSSFVAGISMVNIPAALIVGGACVMWFAFPRAAKKAVK